MTVCGILVMRFGANLKLFLGGGPYRIRTMNPLNLTGVFFAAAVFYAPICPGQAPAARKKASPVLAALPDGRFGKAYDGRQISIIPSNADNAYRLPPLTVECWAKLESPNGFNIIAACDPKASPAHWEIFSHSGTGEFSAHLPGSDPDTFKSDHVITDNQWHYLAMIYEPERIRLFEQW